MTITSELKNIPENLCSIKNKMCQGMEFVKNLTVSNKADIDFKVKSKDSVKPLFVFKKKCDKEVSLLSIIGIVLGVSLIIVLLSDMFKCDCKDNCSKE